MLSCRNWNLVTTHWAIVTIPFIFSATAWISIKSCWEVQILSRGAAAKGVKHNVDDRVADIDWEFEPMPHAIKKADGF